MKATTKDADLLVCIKCRQASARIMCTAGGGPREASSYGARCDAGCGYVMEELPGNSSGRKRDATAEYKRALKGSPSGELKRALDSIAALAPSPKARAPSDWCRGYFCAVSVALREEGTRTPAIDSLFSQGGDWRQADPEDIALFMQHGLTT